MKQSILVLALAAIAFSAAVAQEVSSSPFPESSPEPVVPDKADTSKNVPSVSVTTEKTASPTPKPTASPSPSKPSSSPAPKTSATASATPSSTTVMPQKKSTPEATIREIEDKWEASVMRHDPTIAQTYLADDFRGVSSKGKVMSKSNLLSELKKDTDGYTSTKNGKVDVRVFNGQFAVATGTSTEVGKSKDGADFKRTFRWTDVWAFRKDKWQCVASQAMLVK